MGTYQKWQAFVISLCLNIKRHVGVLLWEHRGGYCVWLLVKIEEQHGTVIPSDSHGGFYFPPTFSTDRAVNIIEIKDFIILWTYSQWRQDLVVIPPLSPGRKIFKRFPIPIHRMLTYNNNTTISPLSLLIHIMDFIMSGTLRLSPKILSRKC